MQKPNPLSLETFLEDRDIQSLLVNLSDFGQVTKSLGQERAEQALEMGMEMQAHGYNILAIGPQGSGRRRTVCRVVESHRQVKTPLQDVVLVNNYEQPERPHVLLLPAGQAVQLRESLKCFIADVQKIVSKQIQSEQFRKERDSLFQQLEGHERQALNNFEKKLQASGFQIVHVDGEENTEAPDLIPIYNGEATTFEALELALQKGEITEEKWQELRGSYYGHMDEMKQIFTSLRVESREMEEKITQLSCRLIEPELQNLIRPLKQKFDQKESVNHFDRTCVDILLNLGEFIRDEENPTEEDSFDPEDQYGINILVNNQGLTQRPFVFEKNPTWNNLLGVIEGKPEEADFMSIKAGSLLQASGGFLVMRLEDLLQEDELWTQFKRVMDSSEVVVQSAPSPLMQSISLKPAPVKIDVKIILTSSEALYEHLYLQDPEFQKLFKVLAEFDASMPLSDENMRAYLAFVQQAIKEDHLLPIIEDGMLEILEYGIRLTKRRDRLTCRLALVRDLLREADYWAAKMQKLHIDAQVIKRAQQMRHYFHNLPQELIWREMKNQQLFIDLQGEAVGKINALVVVDRGFNTFGCPALITAQVFSGKDNIINIEREVGLSGEIHDKGVFILEGFLRGRFARQTPLGIAASLCFEQTYDGVEGDSATLAEVCVLLSALAKFPIKQSIGITGSMNQMGFVQPVGGVAEKIEGFFQICLQQGLTGNQGVIFPSSNLDNIFLSEELKKALLEKQFFLWPIRRVEEALMILSDLEIGIPGKRGKYPNHTLFGRIETELKLLNS
ncbi:MAG: Lon protease family protein [Spirochaetia bacterium]